MNTKEMFLKVKDHLLTQKQKSMFISDKSGDSECAYRGSNGLQCAIGCLIKDEFYDKAFEENNYEDRRVQKAVSKSIGRDLTPDDIELLGYLQGVHDGCDSNFWEEEFEYLEHMHWPEEVEE